MEAISQKNWSDELLSIDVCDLPANSTNKLAKNYLVLYRNAKSGNVRAQKALEMINAYLDKKITDEQFNQITEAVKTGGVSKAYEIFLGFSIYSTEQVVSS